MRGKQKTFAVALSRQMAPTAHIVAYCIVEGEVVADSLSFYVRDPRLMQVRAKCLCSDSDSSSRFFVGTQRQRQLTHHKVYFLVIFSLFCIIVTFVYNCILCAARVT